MLFTVHSMGKDDLSGIVGGGLGVGLVDRRSSVVATSGALDGTDDKSRRKTSAKVCAHAARRVRRRIAVNHCSGRGVRSGQLEVAGLVAGLESDTRFWRIGLSSRIDARHTFTA